MESKVRGFKVTVEVVAEINKHPGADNLELAKLENLEWQFVVGKGEFAKGDKAVYFPLDAVLPEELAKKLNFTNKVVRSTKIRGQISQGLLAPVAKLQLREESRDLSEALGVTKYTEPDKMGNGCILQKLSIYKYELESAANNRKLVEMLMDQKVAVTEKLEGTNFAATVRSTGEAVVHSHGFDIVQIPDKKNDYWSFATEFGVIEQLRHLQSARFPDKNVTVRGELIGPKIQNNIYKLDQRELRVFDILVDGKYINTSLMLEICQESKFTPVPHLSINKTLREFLNGKTLAEASNGKSVLNTETDREGIIVRALEGDRVVLKQRSPEYLAKETKRGMCHSAKQKKQGQKDRTQSICSSQ